ncbi:hypothetical protein DFG55_13695 [Xanthomonas campestris pv. campestris]|nr:hypothetical protein DFG55_13695 [Xanthomonas campestris pv. campestris]
MAGDITKRAGALERESGIGNRESGIGNRESGRGCRAVRCLQVHSCAVFRRSAQEAGNRSTAQPAAPAQAR